MESNKSDHLDLIGKQVKGIGHYANEIGTIVRSMANGRIVIQFECGATWYAIASQIQDHFIQSKKK